tara:strand:+ start:141 stop:1658 length:1518 start_codon:yes stop_codon:yes gene_type:complete
MENLLCLICYEYKPIDSFHEISMGIVGGETICNTIVEDGCKCCLNPADIHICRKFVEKKGFSKIAYEISNIPYYENLKQDNYVKKFFGEDVYYNRGQLADILIKEGYLTTTNPKVGERGKRFKKFHERRNKNNSDFPKLKRIPLHSYKHASNNINSYKYIMTHSDVQKMLDILKQGEGWGKYSSSNKHQLNTEQVEKLVKAGYVSIAPSGNVRFRNHLEKKLKPCRYCGEILPFSMFGPTKNNGWGHCKCIECRKKEDNKIYAKLSEEDKQKHRDRCYAYRKTEKGRESVRKYTSKPEAKAIRTIRRRSTDLIKLLQDTVQGKDHKRLNNHYKGLGCTGRFWRNWMNSLVDLYGLRHLEYGAGKNGDHKDCYHMDHVFAVTVFWDYYDFFVYIAEQCDLPKVPPRYQHLKIQDLLQEGHFLNIRPLEGKENIYRSNVLSCEEINTHYTKVAQIFPKLFPNGYKPIDQKDWDEFEKDLKNRKLQELIKQKEIETKEESIQLGLDLV